jgi:hypothetical protein
VTSPLAGPLASSGKRANPAPKKGSLKTSDATHRLQRSSSSSSRGHRVGRSRLVDLAARLPWREREILETVEEFRLLRSDQVRRLFFSEVEGEAGRARLCRRALAHLADEGLLRRLERRVGGARAGSSGHLYATTATGKRLLAYLSGEGIPSNRGVHEPGSAFVTHTLAVAELYVRLVERERSGTLELISFETEPACWRTYTTPLGSSAALKPDALVRIASGEYEYASFVEIDLGTEGKGAVQRKARVYLAYYRSGREQVAQGVFPQVVWTAEGEARVRFLADLFAALPEEAQRILVVVRSEDSLAALAGESGGEG